MSIHTKLSSNGFNGILGRASPGGKRDVVQVETKRHQAFAKNENVAQTVETKNKLSTWNVRTILKNGELDE